ncbi:TPA: LuxR C-terminal-related transcriptional regulator, partial [Salmonella enterica subsp. enterica serovar Birkenhead]
SPGVMSRSRTARLVRDIRQEALRRLPGTVNARQWFILCCLAEGMKGGEVAALTGLKEKTVSLYRRHALAALGMETVVRGMPLYRGVLVREGLQRYPVAGPADLLCAGEGQVSVQVAI